MTKRQDDDKMPSHQILLAGDEVGWWGWTVDPVPASPVRMYLRRFTGGPLTVELEGPKGQRQLVPSEELPLALEANLALHLARLRPELEARWLELIRGWGWVRIEESEVELYPGSPLAFSRTVQVQGREVASMTSEELAPWVWWPQV
ncbi:MAG: hypothetical protein EA397_01255 [Deltaproteobacteria bacterium]|nr:MAG: hypothetical protein EA397_01255 [Deltaproteobacteria bacterium]